MQLCKEKKKQETYFSVTAATNTSLAKAGLAFTGLIVIVV